MSQEPKVYDVCIVGAGMFGSAAARHAASILGRGTCLVGPGEPKVGCTFGIKRGL